jgi:putative methyltransferase (TIGR04325 family)
MDWLLPTKVKIILRAAASRFVGFTKVKSWEVAVTKSSGYESTNVVEPVVRNTLSLKEKLNNSASANSRYQQVATAMLHCMSAIGLEPGRIWRVLDVGGGGGDYFFYFQKFAPHIRFDWVVLETTALSQAMQQLDQMKDDSISWIDQIEDGASHFDVVLCSSVFQYVEKPQETLNMLAQRTGLIIINRIPLVVGGESCVTVQRLWKAGQRGSYPAHFFGEEEFLQMLSGYGTVSMRWMVPEDQPVLGWKAVPNQGLILEIASPN